MSERGNVLVLRAVNFGFTRPAVAAELKARPAAERELARAVRRFVGS